MQQGGSFALYAYWSCMIVSSSIITRTPQEEESPITYVTLTVQDYSSCITIIYIYYEEGTSSVILLTVYMTDYV